MSGTTRGIQLFFAAIFLVVSSSSAQEKQHYEKMHQGSKPGHSHAKSEIHGGEVVMTEQHHFELVWMHDHVMVYLYDKQQEPLSAKGVTGEVTFKFKDGKTNKAELTRMEAGKMMPEHHGEGEMGTHGEMMDEEMKAIHKHMSDQDHLMASVDLENIDKGEVKAVFHLKGLPGKDENEVTFTSKYKEMNMSDRYHKMPVKKMDQHR